MSIVKSFSVGNGDMFYIDHNSDNFSTIDCCYSDEENRKKNFEEMKNLAIISYVLPKIQKKNHIFICTLITVNNALICFIYCY